MTEYKLIIGGQFVSGEQTMDVINPATGEAFATAPVASPAQLDSAVAAAKAAFPAWSATPFAARAAMIRQLADRLEAEMDDFACLLTQEQGKPVALAQFEMYAAIYTLRGFADMRLEPRIMREDTTGVIMEVYKPLGVVAAITPWNYPVALATNKLAPALLAGNTVVCKPAATTPLTTLRLGALCNEMLPPGVVNVICDRNDLGRRLCAHSDIAKIAFTGSTATGRKVLAAASSSIKRVTLELGGNDAAIVLDDMEPAEAARRLFDGAMHNAGQLCMAVKRAYVAAGLYNSVCVELVKLAEATVVGDGALQDTQMGPVQNQTQYEKLKALLKQTAAEGRIIAGGAPLERAGYFIPPTIVRDIGDSAALVRDEQFGPILPVLSFETIDDVVKRVNDSELGLTATIWTQDFAKGLAIARLIESGTVWVNQHLAIDPALPFRGAKQSGLGTELGQAGLMEYTQATLINAVRQKG
jgi:acyl-CoA reductase-like NAD-dependent aldehyde dehydrogenase